MTRIETRERLLGKIVKARTALIDPGSQRRRRERTSPADHYHISKYAKTSYDLTEWLGDLLDDIAIVVRFSNSQRLLYLTSHTRILFRVLKIIF
jgi:hypothetical protein